MNDYREKGNMLNKKGKKPNPKHQISPYRACGVVGRAHGNKSKYLNPKRLLKRVLPKTLCGNSFFGKAFFSKERFVLNIWILVFGIVWYLGFRVWNLSPQDIEQIREGGCRVAWTILRRSGRRDLSSNLSNPIFVYLKKG
jgi:hypothetical protein